MNPDMMRQMIERMAAQRAGAQDQMPSPGYERNSFDGANFINGGMGGNSSPAPTVPVRDSMENKDMQMAAFAREAARQQALREMLANLIPASPTT